jgi:acyl-coenzyme A synthetase/AMP-(fatty) acid ligase
MGGSTLLQQWAERVAQDALEVALVFNGPAGPSVQLSYQELDTKATRLAVGLQRKASVTVGDRIVLVMPQRPEVFMFVGLHET